MLLLNIVLGCRKGTNVLGILGRLATYALNLTGIFYCQLTSDGFQNQNPSTVEWVSKFTNIFFLPLCNWYSGETIDDLIKKINKFYFIFGQIYGPMSM